jgi:2-polyprenyl-3-methyl-5-hydroxy-6-metoxy-1,4-benzoquinol methylase
LPKFDAYDISSKSIEIAKCLSEKEGLATCINYQVADINNIILDKDKYDIIFVGMAMHHFLNLEHIFEELRKSLGNASFFKSGAYIRRIKKKSKAKGTFNS